MKGIEERERTIRHHGATFGGSGDDGGVERVRPLMNSSKSPMSLQEIRGGEGGAFCFFNVVLYIDPLPTSLLPQASPPMIPFRTPLSLSRVCDNLYVPTRSKCKYTRLNFIAVYYFPSSLSPPFSTSTPSLSPSPPLLTILIPAGL